MVWDVGLAAPLPILLGIGDLVVEHELLQVLLHLLLSDGSGSREEQVHFVSYLLGSESGRLARQPLDGVLHQLDPLLGDASTSSMK